MAAGHVFLYNGNTVKIVKKSLKTAPKDALCGNTVTFPAREERTSIYPVEFADNAEQQKLLEC